MSLLDIFPAPKFLSPEVAGLSINDKFIRFVEFKKNKKGVDLKSFGEQEIEKGLVENGEIKNLPAFSVALSEFKKKHNINFVRVALPEEKGIVFKTTLPKMSDSDTVGVLYFKMEENIPLSADEVVFDYKEIYESKNQREVSVFVLPKKTAAEFLEAIKQAGISPTSFELESQSCAYSTIKKQDNNPHLVIQIDSHKTGFYIVERGVVQYTSDLKPSRENNEKQKGVEGAMPINYIGNDLKIYGQRERRLSPVIAEAEKLLNYWRSSDQGKGRSIKKILVCGNLASNEFGKNNFQDLSVEALLANVWVNVFEVGEQIPEIDFKSSLGYAPAIGAALY